MVTFSFFSENGVSRVGSKHFWNQVSKKLLVILSLSVIEAMRSPFIRLTTTDILWYLLTDSLPNYQLLFQGSTIFSIKLCLINLNMS